MAEFEHLEELVVGLWDREALKFDATGFKLSSGRDAPLYYNQRKLTSFNTRAELTRPQQRRIRELAVRAYVTLLEAAPEYDHLFGIPYSMTALAGGVAERAGDSLLWGVKESEDRTDDYGEHAPIEGDFAFAESVEVLDDAVTTGTSALDTAQRLAEYDLKTAGFVFMFDREEGGAEAIRTAGYATTAVFGLAGAMEILRDAGRIGSQEFDQVARYHDTLHATGLL